MHCEHGHPLGYCGKCLPKAKWPKGRRLCRCKRLILKDAPACQKCQEAALADHFESAHTHRWMMAAVCREGVSQL